MSSDALSGDREWRPLRNHEYPPPGPTKRGEPHKDGRVPILVYAPKESPLPVSLPHNEVAEREDLFKLTFS